MPITCLVCGTLIASGSRCPEHTIRNGSTRAWRTTRLTVLQRDQYRCQIQGPCCTVGATDVDHIVTKRDGGTDNPANLRASCAACNRGRRR